MSFFDKLRGEVEEKPPQKEKERKPVKKIKVETTEPKAKVTEKPKSAEGQLAIDVYEANGDFIIQSTIAGVKAEDLDIAVENDMVSIRGSRRKSAVEEEKGKYFYQECYWGSFSRQIILPEEVDGSRAQAAVKDGILTLRIPKLSRKKRRKITVRQQD